MNDIISKSKYLEINCKKLDVLDFAKTYSFKTMKECRAAIQDVSEHLLNKKKVDKDVKDHLLRLINPDEVSALFDATTAIDYFRSCEMEESAKRKVFGQYEYDSEAAVNFFIEETDAMRKRRKENDYGKIQSVIDETVAEDNCSANLNELPLGYQASPLRSSESTFSFVVGGATKEEEQSIWSTWLDFYNAVKTEEDIFQFSPILYNVIRLGHGLHRSNGVPADMYYKTMQSYSDTAPTKFFYRNKVLDGNQDFIDKIIDAKNLEEMEAVIMNCSNDSQKLIKKIAEAVYAIYNPATVDITHSESSFNNVAVSPCVDAISKCLNEEYKTIFYYGEEKLNALFKLLKETDPTVDSRNGYNADFVVRTKKFMNLEVMIGEISSKYNKQDKSKHSLDHHKGMFGLLSMLKGAADTYHNASVESFKTLKVYFIQAYNEHLYLWSLCYLESNLFCLFRERKVKVPYEFERRGNEVLSYVLFFNEVKELLNESMETLYKLEKEHEETSRARRYMEPEEYVTLSQLIKTTVIKVSSIKGCKGLADEEPFSSPIPF